MRSVIFDNDADYDDFIALAWLSKAPDIDIKAITYVGTGWTLEKYGYDNLLRFADAIGIPKNIPIACGTEDTLIPQKKSVPQELIKQNDDFWDIKLPKSTRKPETKSAVDLIIETCLKSTSPITFLGTGPLSNLALALIKEPAIQEKIETIYITGGVPPKESLKSDPKIIPDHSAGNERSDLAAYETVCTSTIPIYALIPESANVTPITDKHILLGLRDKNTVSNLVLEIMQHVYQDQQTTPSHEALYLWDAVTIYCFLYQKFDSELIDIDFKYSPKKSKDFINENWADYPLHIITRIDRQELIRHFLADITR